jgi:hypothetical protein
VPTRPSDEPHCPTVRDVLPWHVVRQKLAARGVVFKDEAREDVPPSGVHISEKMPVNEPPPEPEEGLSFKVYTLAELDKRNGDSVPPVIRPSMVVLAQQPKPPSPWLPLAKAALAVLYALKTWALMGAGRPALRDALRAPGVVLELELREATKNVAWRRLAVGLAAGLGTACVLLFAVLTVAELTDDLKPARTGTSAMALPPSAVESPSLPSSSVGSPSLGSTSLASPSQATDDSPAPVAAPAAPAAAPAADSNQVVDELDGVTPTPAPPPKAAKKPAKRPAKKAKRDVFNP